MRQQPDSGGADDAPRFLTHLRLRQDPAAGALVPLLTAGGANDTPRQGHHLIWSLFADRKDRRRDFLWTATSPGAFTILSARMPDDRHDLFRIESSEPFVPAIASGDRMRFRLHANPVVSQPRDREPYRMCKHDIITNALRAHPEAERHRLFDQTVRTRGFSWLEAHGRAKGFAIQPDEIRIHGYRRHEIERPDRRGRKRAGNPRYATLDFEGVLTVTNRSRLLRAIAAGFGSSRTWGCGLMLIEPGREAAIAA